MGRRWGHPPREESLGWEKECTSGLQHVNMEVLLPQLDEDGELRVRHTGLLPVPEGGAAAKTGQRMNDVGRKCSPFPLPLNYTQCLNFQHVFTSQQALQPNTFHSCHHNIQATKTLRNSSAPNLPELLASLNASLPKASSGPPWCSSG